LLILLTLLTSLLGCASNEKPAAIRVDYATYNPVSLLLKDKGYLEAALADEGIQVEWVKSLGSNKALVFELP
jgi:sulfonate transport system substrate-binding protein